MKCIWYIISYSAMQFAFWASLYNRIWEGEKKKKCFTKDSATTAASEKGLLGHGANMSASCHQRWRQWSATLAPPLMARKVRRQPSAGVQDPADVADILQLPPQLPACTPGPGYLSFWVYWALSDALLPLRSDAPQAKLIQLEPLLCPPMSVHAPAPIQPTALHPMDAKIWHKTLKEELHHADGAPMEHIWYTSTDQRATEGHDKQHAF